MGCARKSFWWLVNDRPYRDFSQHFPTLKPPLASTPEVGAAIAEAIGDRNGYGLLLGVTPALTGLCDRLVAMDWNASLIARVWPGDTAERRAVEADWRAMPLDDATFTAAIGDGSFNCLQYPGDYRAVFAELARVLTPGARFAVRFFTTPDPCESLADIRDAALTGEIVAIDALKWRLGMAVAAASGNANVARGAIQAAFEETFTDRESLLTGAGWQANDLVAIDWYKGVADTISFPTQAEILAAATQAFRNARFASSGTYELADRCPVLAMDFAP